MRRILILALILLFGVSSVARSRYYGYRRFRKPVRYRTRYSPYALGYNSTGLISGHLRYSPYVLGRSSSGLVPDNVRYSPYALGHDQSGLVADSYYHNYYANYYPYKIIISNGDTYNHYSADHDVDSVDYNTIQKSSNSDRQTSAPSWKITFHHNDFQKQITEPKEPDAKMVIYKYLKSKKIDFKMDRVFVIGSKTISADFLLKDKNVIIKYWNLENVEEITNQSDFSNNMYNKYLQKWTALLEDYNKAGLIVFEINSSDDKEILSQLSRLTELNG